MVIPNKYYAGLYKGVDPNALRIFWATDSHVLASVNRDPNATGATFGTRLFYTGATKMSMFVSDVNANKPHLAMFTGDAVETYTDSSIDLFMSSWSTVDVTVRKEFIAGNHDLNPDPTVLNNALATKVGYGAKALTAGSKYNQTFSISNSFYSVRIIVADTNLDAAGNPVSATVGQINDSVIAFVQNELLTCSENTAIIFTHHGIEDNSAHFDPTDAQDFKTMIDSVKAQRPGLTIFNLFGHNHRTDLGTYTTLGANITGYAIPPVVDNIVGYYAIVYVTSGKLQFEIKPLPYA